ncbi:acyltransferase [Citrobacter amalonaticus]|uniref:acyltransferase n=1 Tax=Citrobacter amalonaticus TaxID=35703 RepID=UPI00292B5ED1|nr:acyltransferase [Citrobacter amalonaticus]MDV0787676.1 acyltransferase [Citrobacter amalonaticus]MEB0643740.1 acyltransferase [Citrobacter amalonaticus]
MRNLSMDLLRVMCCMFVVAIHVTPDYGNTVTNGYPLTTQIESLLIQSIVRTGLPIFFILSGYFLLNRNGSESVVKYFKRMISIIIPFLIYAFPYYIVFYNGSFSATGILHFFTYIFDSSTSLSSHFWFVYSILGIYIIYPAIKFVTDHISEKQSLHVIIFLVLLIAYQAYFYQLGVFIPGFHNIIPIQNLDTWVIYFICGGMIKRVAHSDINLNLNWSIPLLIFAEILLVYFSVNKYNFNTHPYDTNPVMLVLTLLITYLFPRLDNVSLPLRKIASLTSNYTYGLFLVHILVLIKIKENISPYFLNQHGIAMTCTMFILTLLISLIIAIIIDNLLIKPIFRLLKI